MGCEDTCRSNGQIVVRSRVGFAYAVVSAQEVRVDKDADPHPP